MKAKVSWKDVYNLILVIKRQHQNVVWLLMLGSITTAVIPYVSIYYSSKILNLVLRGEYDACIPKVAILLITNLVCGMISRACEQGITGIIWVVDETLQQQIVKKAYLMEYEELEKTETLDAIRRVKDGTISSGGVGEQLDSVYRFLKSAVSLVLSIVFVISLFLKVGKGTVNFWNSHWSTFVLIVIYLVYFYVCIRLVKKSKSKVNEIRRKNEHMNSVAFYLYNIFFNNSFGKDIRLRHNIIRSLSSFGRMWFFYFLSRLLNF